MHVTRSPRSLAVRTAFLLLAAAPALAQDDPAPKPKTEEPAPAKSADAPAVERRVSEPALEKLKAWGKAMHLPAQSTADHIEAKASADNESMFQGGHVSVTTSWDRKTGLELSVTLPDEMTRSMPPQAVEMAKSVFTTWAREALAPAFEAPTQYARNYHVDEVKEGDKTVVKLLPCTDDAAAEVQRLYFDDRGLCERRVLIPRVDPNDPAQQMMIGVEVESTFGYEKVGERYVLKRMSMLLPFGEMLVEYGYYEVTDGPPLLKTVTMATPFAPDPISVTLSDYTLDGNAVAATKKQEKEPEKDAPDEPQEKPGDSER